MGLCLDGLDLSHSTLRGAIFCDSSLKGANLHNTDLTNAVFGPPELVEAKFALSPLGTHLAYGADMEGADLSRATITDTQFRECNLRNANLSHTNHRDASFKDAVLDGVVYSDDDGTLESRAWGWLEQLEIEQKRSLFHSVFALANVDGDVCAAEKEMLFTVSRYMKLTQEQFESFIPQGTYKIADIHLTPPEDVEDGIAWMKYLLTMALVDGGMTEHEHAVCVYFAKQLGFSKAVVNEALLSV
jgi:hypothetical protein